MGLFTVKEVPATQTGNMLLPTSRAGGECIERFHANENEASSVWEFSQRSKEIFKSLFFHPFLEVNLTF